MADSLSIQVIGDKELARACGEVVAGFEAKALKEANLKATQTVVKLALPMVPVASGRLRSSVRGMATAKKGNVVAGTGKVNYAAAIHWGRKTGNVWHGKKGPNPIKGRPYLHNAKNAALSSGQLERDYQDACMNLINNFF